MRYRRARVNGGACFFGSSSFGVDLIVLYIKSTPNDEEPRKQAR